MRKIIILSAAGLTMALASAAIASDQGGERRHGERGEQSRSHDEKSEHGTRQGKRRVHDEDGKHERGERKHDGDGDGDHDRRHSRSHGRS